MRIVLTVMLLVFYVSVYSQNLVPNGDFERYSSNGSGPINFATDDIVGDWFNATGGTADYYLGWSRRERDRDNWSGFQLARSGQGYCGIVARYHFRYKVPNDLRDYLEVRLTKPMNAKQRYKVIFYVFLAPNAAYALNSFGALFTNEKIDSSKYFGVLNFKPQIINNPKRMLHDAESWVEIEDTYQAKGGEQYMTIGNFTPNSQIEYEEMTVQGYNRYDFAYYFIDDVAVEPIGAELFDYETLILDKILFKTGEAVLLSGSLEDLQKIISLLTDYPEIKVEISGHTDNQGQESANIKLSSARALAVVDYLASQNVDVTRITTKGYGSSKPITENTTEDGRKRNRRVEMKVIKD